MTWLRRLVVWLAGDPPDPAWQAQRPVPKFTGYDAELARRGSERARGLTPPPDDAKDGW